MKEGQKKQRVYGAMVEALWEIGRKEYGEVHVEKFPSLVRDEDRCELSIKMAPQPITLGSGCLK